MSNTSTQYRMVTVPGYEGGMRVSQYVGDTLPTPNFGTCIVTAIREHMRGVKEAMICGYWHTVSHVVALADDESLPTEVRELMRACVDVESNRLGCIR